MPKSRREGGSQEISSPPMWMLPRVCVSKPAMQRSSVVLPQPEGPRKQMNSPSATLKLTSVRARKPPKSLLTPSSCRNPPLAGLASAVMTTALSGIGPGRAPARDPF